MSFPEESAEEEITRKYHFAWVCQAFLKMSGHPVMISNVWDFARANNCYEILLDLMEGI